MKKICLIGFFIVGALGTLFHFCNEWIPLFIFPMNESIFEHVKLVVFPFLLYYVILLFFKISDKGALFTYFFTAILASALFMVAGYYTYSGVVGSDNSIANIVLFFLSVIVGFIVIYKKKTLFSFPNSVIALIILLILLVVFSYYPPDIAFFKNPNLLQERSLFE